MRFFRFSWLLLALLFVCPLPASARVLLKPNGQNAMPLRIKTLQADIQISGQFAQTTTQMVFQNELSRRVEADFIYTVPDDTTVTYFAYWFGEEKVVARIVEKERAAQIYGAITARQRDPALVEMIDKNTFRARIFPVEPNADLKVEIHSVQTLPADARGALYTFPLKPEEDGKGTLEKVDLKIRVASDATQIINNYNLPMQTQNGATTLSLSQRNWRAPQDLTIRLTRPMKALQSSLYGARAGGSDGFFALALTPSQNLKNPRLQIDGVSTYGVLPRRLPSLEKHETITIVGRYKGSGAAKISLSGYDAGAQAVEVVNFNAAREADNLASKLWAARTLEDLGADDGNRAKIIELSKRFNLPGKFTSWLAVPESEMKLYKSEQTRAEMNTLGKQLAQLFATGKDRTPKARRLRESFNEKARYLEEDPQEALAPYLSSALYDTARAIVSEKSKDQPSQSRLRHLQTRLGRMEKAAGTDSEWARRAREIVARDALDSVLNQMTLVVQRGETARSHQLRQRAKELSVEAGINLASRQRDTFYNEMREIARLWAREKFKENAKQSYLDNLNLRLQRLSAGASQTPDAVKKEAAINQLQFQFQKLSAPLAKELVAGRSQSKKARSLRAQAQRMGERLGIAPEELLTKTVRNELTGQAQEIGRKYVAEKHKFQPDTVQLEQWQSELKRIAEAGDTDVETLLKAPRKSWATGAMNGAASQLVWERAQPKPDKKRVKFLREQLEEAVAIYRQSASDYMLKQATVDNYLASAEINYWDGKIREFDRQIAAEKSIAATDKERLTELEREREKILSTLSATGRKGLDRPAASPAIVLYGARDLLLNELRKDDPQPERVAQLEQKLVEMEKHDWRFAPGPKYYTQLYKNIAPELFGKLRAERLEVRVAREKVEQNLKYSDATQMPVLQAQRAQLVKRQKQLTVRMGDPLIAVEAPADAQQVVALLPGGVVKKLAWNEAAQKWEARFDIPTYASEGEYAITIIVVLADGARQTMTMRYRVDLTPPAGAGQAQIADAKVVRLECDGDDDTARIFALLPWGEKVEMSPSSQRAGGFFALVSLPAEYSGDGEKAAPPITFVLTDRAHNRTSVSVDLTR